MSGVQTRLQKEAAVARTAADAASAAAGEPQKPMDAPAAGQASTTDQMLAFFIAQGAQQQRIAAAQLAQQKAAAAEAAALGEATLAQVTASAEATLAQAAASAAQVTASAEAALTQAAAASAAALAQATAASTAAISQRQRTAAGPAPVFHGKANSIEAHRWLLAQELWCRSAHVGEADEKTRLEVAAAGLRDAAQAWWATKRADGTADALITWAAFADSVRKQFMPVDIDRWAMRERDALVGAAARNKDVLSYTAAFNELDMLMPGEREVTRVMAYERGLPLEYSVKCAERRFATLAEATAAMTALWHAKGSARHPPASLSHTEGLEPAEGAATPSAASAAAPAAAGAGLFSDAQMAQLSVMFAERSEQRFAGRGRGGRGGRTGGRSEQREGQPRARSRTPGLSDELAKARWRANQCINCGQAGHFKAECTNAAKTN
jgi:hypothetical protein